MRDFQKPGRSAALAAILRSKTRAYQECKRVRIDRALGKLSRVRASAVEQSVSSRKEIRKCVSLYRKSEQPNAVALRAVCAPSHDESNSAHTQVIEKLVGPAGLEPAT